MLVNTDFQQNPVTEENDLNLDQFLTSPEGVESETGLIQSLITKFKNGWQMPQLMNLDSTDTFEWINGFIIGRCYQFTALNYPNKAIRHRRKEIWIDDITTEALFIADSTWKAQHGLTGAADSISFEASNFPGRYMTHYGNLLYAVEGSGDKYV